MTKAQTAINIILAIAVAALAFFQFKGKTTAIKKIDSITEPAKLDATRGAAPNDTTVKIDAPPKEFKMAYYNIDVLEKETKFFKDANAYETQISDEASRKIEALKASAQNEAEKNNPQKAANDAEFQAMNGKLQGLQENLQNEVGKIREEYETKIVDYKKKLRNKFEVFLAQFNTTKGYAYIMAYTEDISMISYKNNSFDITKEVKEALNAAY